MDLWIWALMGLPLMAAIAILFVELADALARRKAERRCHDYYDRLRTDG